MVLLIPLTEAKRLRKPLKAVREETSYTSDPHLLNYRVQINRKKTL